MDKGFELRLKDYCSFCPDFEPDVDKVDITVMTDKTPKSLTTIRCENAGKCERIYERITKEGKTDETAVVQSHIRDYREKPD